VLTYLGPHTHRVAIANSRLTALGGGELIVINRIIT
jgi:hypothetical protein